jgi:hypothetical protein
MMKNKTIYLVKITKSRDYESDTIIDIQAFSTAEKADEFMVATGLTNANRTCGGGWALWTDTNNLEIFGTIVELEVN